MASQGQARHCDARSGLDFKELRTEILRQYHRLSCLAHHERTPERTKPISYNYDNSFGCSLMVRRCWVRSGELRLGLEFKDIEV